LNILFLSTENPFPVDHGHHIRTYHVLKALAAEHTVHFLGFSQNEAGFENKDKLYEFCETVRMFRLRYRGWRQLILAVRNSLSSEPFIIQKYFEPEAAACVRKTIMTHKIDLVHYDMLHLTRYRDFARNIPGILVNHNVESLRLQRRAEVAGNVFLRAFLRNQYFKLRDFESQACGLFERCVVVSDYDRSVLAELCEDGEYVVIPNGVDCSCFKPSDISPQPNSLVWTGSMRNPYNRDAVEFLFDAIWPRVVRSVPQASATIVGALPSRRPTPAVGSESVTFTGYVDDVRPFVDRSAVFVAPLRSGSGTKIKILNAMAQASAVVTTSVGAEGIEARNGHELVVADSPEKFASKTVELLNNPDAAATMGRNARRLMEERYDWEVINRSICQLYTSFDRSVKEEALPVDPVVE